MHPGTPFPLGLDLSPLSFSLHMHQRWVMRHIIILEICSVLLDFRGFHSYLMGQVILIRDIAIMSKSMAGFHVPLLVGVTIDGILCFI